MIGLLLFALCVSAATAGRIERAAAPVAPRKTQATQTGGASAPAPAVDPRLIALSEELYTLDQQGNAAPINSAWAVNTRSTTGRLFTKLDKSIFKKPTYAALIALHDNYISTLGVAENNTPAEKKEQSDFLDAILDTPVMERAKEFLVEQALAPADNAEFKALLQKIWFTIYRRKGQPDTSGFEHVFVGEIKGSAPTDEVEGVHNWVFYANEEAAGRIKFGRWKGQSDPDLYGMQFTWNGHTKIKSTIAIGESPEMSMAVLTTCFLYVPNEQCNLRMGGAPVSVQSYRWDDRYSSDYYVASAYYNN